MGNTNRRRFLTTASLSALALVGGCVGSTDDEGEHPITESVTAWPSFRGDRHNTGYAKGVASTGEEPSVEWVFDTDGPVWSSPIVADGSVYVGSADHSVYAIDAATGEREWAFETEDRVEGTAAYAAGTSVNGSDRGSVYVGSYDEHVYAIDAETGEQRWASEVGGLVRGGPIVHEDAVIIGVGCHNLACEWHADDADVPETGWVYSLDAASGEPNWRHEVGNEVVSTPAIAGGTIYIGASDGVLYALEAATGDVEWTYETGGMIWSSPAVAFGTVYVGDWDGVIHAVDAASSEVEWTTDTGGYYISGSVAVDETAVYVGETPFNAMDAGEPNYANVYRFDRTDGELEWRFETTTTEIGSSPVVTDDRLYIGTHRPTEGGDAGVHALSTDGDEAWFLETGGRGVGSSPALLEGTLYFGGTDGRVYAVE
ncbi:outer membrane protein assembly factor BamB family protein [Natronococcus occultus]|uniref:WD40-like repeat protein n=1 Tax=Natronococcus occultus SP4 TaxID=694430 RepID=L0K2V3_9EURY|nr:PQQ-binding-like beta-propeller repeat protein [Natronococcus occultus]AGB38870.1 WD40-like repeat protein [Natronococcus occultus SP4]